MADKPLKLYGYDEQWKQIQAAIAGDDHSLRFLCLVGPGGIGKTTMLRAVLEHYEKDTGYAVTHLLDFDDLGLHIAQNVVEAIAGRLRADAGGFASYREAAGRLHREREAGSSQSKVRQQEILLYDCFVEDYNHAAEQQRRCVILLDTVERAVGTEFWRTLIELLPRLRNTVVLLAGREDPEGRQPLTARLKLPATAETIRLGGLDPEERLDYFQRTPLGQYLVRENAQRVARICWLSDGRPILLDLAVDWMGQGMEPALPEAEENLGAAPSEAAKRQFARCLVQQVMDLGQPRNEAILEMAHVHHSYNAARYCQIHQCDPRDEQAQLRAQALIQELAQFSFVKLKPDGAIRLHDEMRRMVCEWVWPALDASGERRRWLSRQMVAYLASRRGEWQAGSPLGQTMTAELLYHELCADLKNGHQLFLKLFKDQLNPNGLAFAHVLFNTLIEFRGSFDPELNAWCDAHKGRLLRAEERVQEAEKLIRPARDTLKGLKVRRELDTVCNALGYCYRLLGHWDKAIAAYEEALEYSREEQDVQQIAETMNNLANTCRLSGDLEKANRYSLVSLKIREHLGGTKSIANSCFVRGMICWEVGNTAEAATYAGRARQLFEEIHDQEGIANVGRFESYLRFRTGDLQGALECLAPSREYFQDKGISLGLANTLNLQARILIDQIAAGEESEERKARGGQDRAERERRFEEQASRYAEIEKLAKAALDVAERIADGYSMAESHLTLCRLYIRWAQQHQNHGQEESAQALRQKAREEYENDQGGRAARERNYLSLLSVYEWAMGDLAFMGQDWKTAFGHYLNECATSARFKAARFARALNGLSDRMHRLAARQPAEVTQEQLDYVIAAWRERGLQHDYPELTEECQYIKGFFRVPDPQHQAALRSQGADLLVQGRWQKALDAYNELLECYRGSNLTEEVAWALNQSAWADRQMGRFTEARRLCQQSLLIRQLQVKDNRAALAGSRLVMGTIMWVTGNTSEAARALRIARNLYEEVGDEVGLAQALRHTAFLHFRINDFANARKYLARAEQIFRREGLHGDLADVLNLTARVLRAEGRRAQARTPANESRRLAEQHGSHYTLAEAYLTLGNLEQDAVEQALASGDNQRAGRHLAQAAELFARGYPLAQRYGNELLLSVYEGAFGEISFREGRYADAFEHLLRDLEFGSRYERSRMRRELDRITGHLLQLPSQLRRFYANYMIMEWQEKGLAESEPDVPRLLQLLMEYEAYVEPAAG